MDFSRYRVPGSTIACNLISLFICFFAHIIFMLIWKKKTGARLSAFFWGVFSYFVFVFILQSAFDQILYAVKVKDLIRSDYVVSAIYFAAAAAVFEEFGRLIVMNLHMKKTLTKKDSVMFGFGHGGLESVLVFGMQYLANMRCIRILNSGNGNAFVSGLNSSQQMETFNNLKVFWAENPAVFLAGGIERIIILFFHVCCSYLVYRAVKFKETKWFFISLATHFAFDFFSNFIQHFTESKVIVELYYLTVTAVFVAFIVRFYKKEPEKAEISVSEEAVSD